jgi:Cu+-exporting ATPase
MNGEWMNHVEWDTVEQTIKVAYYPNITDLTLLIQCIQNVAQPPSSLNALMLPHTNHQSKEMHNHE